MALVDLNLPGESGADLVRWLQARATGPAVVLMTGADGGAEPLSPVGDGCAAVVSKPLDFADLPALLTRAAARHGGARTRKEPNHDD
ncbi:MAG: response regulator [Krumholzibacteria bacterium]|nr:response regulator [Candidatus Krumholzibacteria bacterium]